jgi:hypothetical protein
MVTKRLFNLNLDGVFLPLQLPIVSLTYMGVPIDLPVVGMSAVVNGKARNVAGYNHRLYGEFASNEIAISQSEVSFLVVEDGLLIKQNDQIREIWFPSSVRGDICVRSGKIITHLNVGQWHYMRFSAKDRTLLLPVGRTSVYFRFDQKWSLQIDALTPSKA